MLLILMSLALASDVPSAVASEPAPIAVAVGVDPNVQYLTEQIKSAMIAGAPIASDGIHEVCAQISSYGLWSIGVYSVFTLIFSTLTFLTLYISNKFSNSDSYSQREAAAPLIFVSVGFGLLVFICLTNIPEKLEMYVAPTIWALENLK